MRTISTGTACSGRSSEGLRSSDGVWLRQVLAVGRLPPPRNPLRKDNSILPWQVPDTGHLSRTHADKYTPPVVCRQVRTQRRHPIAVTLTPFAPPLRCLRSMLFHSLLNQTIRLLLLRTSITHAAVTRVMSGGNKVPLTTKLTRRRIPFRITPCYRGAGEGCLEVTATGEMAVKRSGASIIRCGITGWEYSRASTHRIRRYD